jgi:anti-sigma factor RsiW
MTCRELIDQFLMNYLDGELTPPERASFEEHLRVCGPCRRYLDSYKETVRLGNQVGSTDTRGGDVPDALVRAILEARKKRG